MVLQPTPVKRLLAEQLAVPEPQLSFFFFFSVSILYPPFGDFTPHK